MKKPNLYYERKLWSKGYGLVAGVDEVGRGSFAGPIVASAVAFAPMANYEWPRINEDGIEVRINDSKKLTDKQRRVSDKWIKENALTWGIGEVSVSEINKLGVSKAACSAFRRAIAHANIRVKRRIDYLLVDAYFVPYTRDLPIVHKKHRKRAKLGNRRKKEIKKLIEKKDGRQLAIINGDERSVSIASASIVAKVYRDDLMIRLSKYEKNNNYLWEENKGYGTKKHRDAIKKHGTNRHHRRKFVEKLLKKNTG